MANDTVIVWQSLVTGFKSKGNPIPLSAATAWVEELNEKYPDIEHEAIVPIPAPPAPLVPLVPLVPLAAEPPVAEPV